MDTVRLQRPGFDLTRPHTFHAVPHDVDVVVHAAGHVGEAADESVIWDVNVKPTFELGRFLSEQRTPRLVLYLSSGAVYDLQDEPVTTDTPPRPPNVYALSKLLAERSLESVLGNALVIARIFFPFGPGQKLPRLVPRLMYQIQHNEPVRLNSERGLPAINPIFNQGLAEQIAQIIHEPRRRVYNLGGSKHFFIRDIAAKIGDALQVQPEFVVGDGPAGNLMCHPDLQDAEGLTFEEAIQSTANAWLEHAETTGQTVK